MEAMLGAVVVDLAVFWRGCDFYEWAIYGGELPQSAKQIVDMTAQFSKDQLVAALKNTFIGNTQSLKETTEYLNNASKQVGFCMGMMEIVDDPSLTVEVKQAALVQLKNNVKMRWLAKKEELDPKEKEQIKGALLLAVIRCQQAHKLIKIYKEVFTIIIGHEYKVWFPINAIIERIQQEQDLVPLLHVLLAMAASFEFSITEEERTYFFEFLKACLPTLLQLATKRQDPELIYLCIKFLWKAVHYEISMEIKMMACGWMELLHAVIGATNPAYDAAPEDFQQKGTPEFFYFHSKKWATRVLLRFFQKHAKRVTYNRNEDNRPFADQWFAQYGGPLITALINQFAVKTTKKVRYFQLKSLQVLIGERPELVKQYAEAFQYDILLAYLRLQPEDEELAQRDPVDFLSKEDEPSVTFTNLKRVATDVWIGFAELGCKIEKKGQPYEPGVFFFQNMNYLQGKLEAGHPVEKELAMYLICQLRMPITRCKQVKQMLPTLIAKYVVPEFNNEIMFLRARAVDIFTEYGGIELEVEVVRQSVEGIYNCLTKDSYPLVRIKAASAFNCILKHKVAKDMVQPLLKDILTVYLQLLESYDLENIINSLESIVEDFATEIAPFAFELTKHLVKLFFKLFNRDIEQANQEEYDGEAELAAAGCLKTITRIIESPIPKEALGQLEGELIAILEFIFSEEGIDYIEDSLMLLNAYLFKAERMTGQVWFFFQVVVYNMVGIPREMWEALEKLPMGEKQKRVMRNIRNGENSEMMEQSMLVLRNYIQKTAALGGDPQQEVLKGNMVNLLFYLVSETYKKGANEFSGELDITCCTALMLYLLENFQAKLPENVYSHMWEFSKINIHKFKSKMLRVLNSQLLALLLWVAPTHVLTLAHKDNLLPTLLRELTNYETKYEETHERARVILGLNSLLALPEKPQELMPKMPDIFRINLKLIRKNAEERVSGEEGEEENDFEDQVEEEDYRYESDDEDFWEEQYDVNYSSGIDGVDQIGEFKKVMEWLAQQQTHFYQEIVTVVPQEELIAVQEKIRVALEKVEILAGIGDGK